MNDLELAKNCPAIIAGHALRYLLDQRDSECHVRHDGPNITWYIGWGGRTVVRHGSNYQLKSFRRFEHRGLKLLESTPIDVNAVIRQFKNQASKMKGEENE